MKALILATAATLTLTGAASAMTEAGPVFASQLSSYSNVDASTLTGAQIDALKLVISSGDGAADTRATVRSIVNG